MYRISFLTILVGYLVFLFWRWNWRFHLGNSRHVNLQLQLHPGLPFIETTGITEFYYMNAKCTNEIYPKTMRFTKFQQNSHFVEKQGVQLRFHIVLIQFFKRQVLLVNSSKLVRYIIAHRGIIFSPK